MTVTDRFVVGTGRCGSTLLSLLLAEHREVVSLHELFTGLDWGRRFATGPVTGAELAELITAEQPVTTEVMKRGHVTDEIFHAVTPYFTLPQPEEGFRVQPAARSR